MKAPSPSWGIACWGWTQAEPPRLRQVLRFGRVSCSCSTWFSSATSDPEGLSVEGCLPPRIQACSPWCCLDASPWECTQCSISCWAWQSESWYSGSASESTLGRRAHCGTWKSWLPPGAVCFLVIEFYCHRPNHWLLFGAVSASIMAISYALFVFTGLGRRPGGG